MLFVNPDCLNCLPKVNIYARYRRNNSISFEHFKQRLLTSRHYNYCTCKEDLWADSIRLGGFILLCVHREKIDPWYVCVQYQGYNVLYCADNLSLNTSCNSSYNSWCFKTLGIDNRDKMSKLNTAWKISKAKDLWDNKWLHFPALKDYHAPVAHREISYQFSWISNKALDNMLLNGIRLHSQAY